MEIRLNDAGHMVEQWWLELTHRFARIEIDVHIVMPDHFHGIILIVGADRRVCPGNDNASETSARAGVGGTHAGVGGTHAGVPVRDGDRFRKNGETDKQAGVSIPKVVQWFKTMTTNAYIKGVKKNGWMAFEGKLWQRNYYEHIIRNESDLNNIREYIIANPAHRSEYDNNAKRLR